MSDNYAKRAADALTPFDRKTFDSSGTISVIGSGSVGGKGQGLAFIKDSVIPRIDHQRFPTLGVNLPTLTVLATEVFDEFMKENDLHGIAMRDDLRDDQIAHAFVEASLPADIVGDLKTLSDKVHSPLAVRSSSLFEDALREPFAGVYRTKMIPHNNDDPDYRFKRLTDAIKYVWASTFFRDAKNYIRTTKQKPEQEKMAVIIQKVVGFKRGERFYPVVSGVVRSYNFYRSGSAKPEDGIVSLALGLGKQVVDGGKCWTYSPAYPRANPPYKSLKSMVNGTQSRFWAINLGHAPYDPLRETEFLIRGTIADAEADGTLRYVASTFQADNDRIVTGIIGNGPRLITFAPLLKLSDIPLNDMIKYLVKLCEETVGHEVEMEFAMTIDTAGDLAAKFWILQVRPMFVSHAKVEVADSEFETPDLLCASERVLGNGYMNTIRDVIFLKPKVFDERQSHLIADELEALNHKLTATGHPYLLIAFGRLGTTDPPAGIPVQWWQISGAKVIVETSLPDLHVELSQGSHFFHNVISSQVGYFSVPHTARYPINWEWLNAQHLVSDSEFVRCVKLSAPLKIKIDGRRGRGIVAI